MDTRIERHLRLISQTVLVDLPVKAVSMTQFIDMQDHYIQGPSKVLVEKNKEAEQATRDLVRVAKAYALHPSIAPVQTEDVDRLMSHYNHFLYQVCRMGGAEVCGGVPRKARTDGSAGFKP